MLERSCIPAMLYNDHRPWNSPTVLGQRIPMVWTPAKSHHRQGPLFHISFRQSAQRKAGDPTKPIIRVSPPNRRHLRKEEPMGQTIPPFGNIRPTRRLDTLALHGLRSSQQSEERHHWTIAQSNSTGVRTHPPSIRNATIKQRSSPRTSQTSDGKKGASGQRHQSNGR